MLADFLNSNIICQSSGISFSVDLIRMGLGRKIQDQAGLINNEFDLGEMSWQRHR